MNYRSEEKNENLLENIIGVLLILPVYIIIFAFIVIMLQIKRDNTVLLPFLMYIPVLIGVIVSYKEYKDKVGVGLVVVILNILFLSFVCYYNVYFRTIDGWEGLGDFILWLPTTFVCRIVSLFYYKRIVGWEKAAYFMLLYILIVGFSILIVFWT